MKRCPKCQKTFDDSLRFCQTDGTLLLEDVGNTASGAPDPYKTVVGGTMKKDDDILDIPDNYDPMKTMVSLPEGMKFDAQKNENQPPPSPFGDQILNLPPLGENKPPQPLSVAPEPPKFNEPSLSPPSFGDLSPSSKGSSSGNQSSTIEPPNFEPPPPVQRRPVEPPAPFGSSPFDKPASPTSSPTPSPYDKIPPSSPPPAYKMPEPMFGGQQPPFNQSPFGQPETPFGQSNKPSNQSMQQNEWAPPPAPVANWQDQGLGAETPFQPPAVAGSGQNQTLPIISLILGILSLCCYVSPLTGIGALITGYLGMKNANNDPAHFGGKTLAIVGMVLGGLFLLIGVVYWILILFVGFAGFALPQ